MGKAYVSCVEHKALPLFPCAIEPVPHYWDSQTFRAGGRDSELMGTAGQRCELHQSFAIIYRKPLPKCYAHPAMNRVVDLVGSVSRIKPERESQCTALTAEYSIQKSCILLMDMPALKLHGEEAVALLGQRQHQDAGCVHIQPVHGRVVDAVGIQPFNTVYNTVLLVLSPSGHRQQPCRFVNYNYLLIQVKDIQSQHLLEEGPAFLFAGWVEPAGLPGSGRVCAAVEELGHADWLQVIPESTVQ